MLLEQLLGSHLIRHAVIKGKADCQRKGRGAVAGVESMSADPMTMPTTRPMQPRRSGAAQLGAGPSFRYGVRCHRLPFSTHRSGGSSIRRRSVKRVPGRCMTSDAVNSTICGMGRCAHVAGIAVGYRLSAMLGPKHMRANRTGQEHPMSVKLVRSALLRGAEKRFSVISGAKGSIRVGHLVTSAARTHSDSSSVQRPKRRLCQSRCPARCQAPKSKTTRSAWPATQV